MYYTVCMAPVGLPFVDSWNDSLFSMLLSLKQVGLRLVCETHTIVSDAENHTHLHIARANDAVRCRLLIYPFYTDRLLHIYISLTKEER